MSTTEQDAKHVAVVTGSARGIGAATCRALAKGGFKVMINDRTHSDEARKLMTEIRDCGGTAEFHECDLTIEEDVIGLIDHTRTLWGGVGVLCNNAGINQHRELSKISREDWINILNANLLPCFLATKAVLPLMVTQRWGRIINISSASAYVAGQPCPGAHYVAAKGAVSAFGRCLAADYASSGITVNTIAPGRVGTERTLSIRSPEETERRAQQIPMRRLGQPAEIGETVAFLASDAAAFITGQTIHVNGGTYLGA